MQFSVWLDEPEWINMIALSVRLSYANFVVLAMATCWKQWFTRFRSMHYVHISYLLSSFSSEPSLVFVISLKTRNIQAIV